MFGFTSTSAPLDSGRNIFVEPGEHWQIGQHGALDQNWVH